MGGSENKLFALFAIFALGEGCMRWKACPNLIQIPCSNHGRRSGYNINTLNISISKFYGDCITTKLSLVGVETRQNTRVQ